MSRSSSRFLRPLITLVATFCAGVATAGNPEPKVSVRSTGSGEVEPLRYQYKEGATSKQTVRMATTMAIAAEGLDALPEMPFPLLVITVESTVEKVGDDGVVRIVGKVTDADAESVSGVPDEVIETAKKSIPTLEGLEWTLEQDTRGFIKGAKLSRPSGLSDDVKQMVDELEAQLTASVMPLPDEPVGVGAEWEVTYEVEAEGGTTEQHTVRYEYTGRDGTVVKLGIVHTSKGTAPPFSIPGLPVEVKVEPKEAESESKGTGSEDLALPAATTRDMRAEAVHHYEVPTPEGTKRFTVTYKSEEKVTLD